MIEVVSLSGEHDLESCDELVERIATALGRGRPVLVDLSDCTFLDAAVMEVLRIGHREAQRLELGYAVLVPFGAPRVVRLLAFDLHPDVAPYPVVPDRAAAERVLAPQPLALRADDARFHAARRRAWELGRQREELLAQRNLLVLELRDRLRERVAANARPGDA